jgi:small conductance mechanosensitive channel
MVMEILIESTKVWLLNHGIPIVLILIVAWVARRILKIVISRFEKGLEQKGAVPSEQEKRVKTLSGIISTTISVIIYTAALMMIITECGINIGPLLAGAGIAGLAIGFGAQSLVKDVISGFFLIMEDQIRVGDVANIAGIGGLVEAINLRTTRLRDLEGKVHIIPNGSIEVATNFTKDWSRALIEIGVAYKENVDNVISVLQGIGEEMRNDSAFKEVILEPMTVLGLDSFGDSSINIRLYFKTLPIKQWEVAREFRKRVKKVFDEKGIEIPFPHRTIYMGEGESTGRLKVEATVNSTQK